MLLKSESRKSKFATASRVLEEYTGLKDVFLEELGYYGEVERDPGGRVISIGHFALIRLNEQDKGLAEKYQKMVKEGFDFKL